MTGITLAYRAHPKITKDWFVREMEAHQRADRLLQGTYDNEEKGRDFKGCAVGCSLKSIKRRTRDTTTALGNHHALAERLGWPVWLTEVEDHIFESLEPEDAREWPLRLANAVPDGADLSRLEIDFVTSMYREKVLPHTPAGYAPMVELVILGMQTDWKWINRTTLYSDAYEIWRNTPCGSAEESATGAVRTLAYYGNDGTSAIIGVITNFMAIAAGTYDEDAFYPEIADILLDFISKVPVPANEG